MGRRPARPAAGLAVLGLLLVFWQYAGTVHLVAYLPTMTDAIGQMWAILTGPSLQQSVLPSVARALAGFAVGSTAGCLVGVALGSFRGLDAWTRPALEFMRATPLPVVLPVAVALVGGTDVMRVAVIAAGAFWPVMLNAEDGTRSVDPYLLDTARVCGTGRAGTLRRVIWPAAMPFIFAGLRTALGISLVLMVVSEMVASTSGLGYLVLQAQRLYDMPQMFGGVILLGILGYLLTVGFSAVERRAIAWYYGQKGGAFDG